MVDHAGRVLSIPIIATTQNTKALGSLVPDLGLEEPNTGHRVVLNADKSKFSMMVPEVHEALNKISSPADVIIVGIESHICVTQTVLDLLAAGHWAYVLADGVSR